ncbi:MAG: hydroxymethylglutaryl-CoA reductase, degradative [Anaerolineales bacterium]
MGEQEKSSRFKGFYNLTIQERQKLLREEGFLTAADLPFLNEVGGLSLQQAEHMIENVIGCFAFPLGVGLNFLINGKDVLVPMVIEEPSVIAGASYMAKITRPYGGFQAHSDPPLMIGQLQVLDVVDVRGAQEKIESNKEELLAEIADVDLVLQDMGGGPKDLEVRVVEDSPLGPFLILHLLVDVRDAMGANAVNTACERLAPHIEDLVEGRVHLRILSNLADRRLARAECLIPPEGLGFQGFRGEEVRDGIIEAWAFADADPYRAATHNKGIFNGVDAVLLATGNDWRAVEAGAHAYAAQNGRYRPLSTWQVDENGNLSGRLEMPLAVGTVGGATRSHPLAQLALRMMDVSSAGNLAEVIVAVGLAQNLAAIRALATEGIQKGHMTLHARQVALSAGAEDEEITRLARQLVREDQINASRAREILSLWRDA